MFELVNNRPPIPLILSMAIAVSIGAPAVFAADLVCVTSGAVGDWDVSELEFGKRIGKFDAKGIEPQVSYWDGSAPTLQAIISGSSDIGVGVGVSGFLTSAIKGAPTKIVSSQYTRGVRSAVVCQVR